MSNTLVSVCFNDNVTLKDAYKTVEDMGIKREFIDEDLWENSVKVLLVQVSAGKEKQLIKDLLATTIVRFAHKPAKRYRL